MSKYTDSQLTDDQIEERKDAFGLFDKNSDGRITLTELGTVMQSLVHNPTKAEIKEIINELDSDGSGYIDLVELVSTMSRKMKDCNPEKEMMEAFKNIDKDGDGYVIAAEIKYILTGLGENLTDQDFKDIITAADVELDGKINYKEFVKLMVGKNE